MAFDMGFDYRFTAGYVTDPAYGVPVLAEAYPHTYTNGNGDSINAGWSSAPSTSNASATNDPRIAGANYTSNVGTPLSFTVDLSSGSAPGAGPYTVDLALGFAGGGFLQSAEVRDNTTLLIDVTNGGSGYADGADHFRDATVANVLATTSWTGTTASKTFATTTAVVKIGVNSIGGLTTLAHFRLTLAETPAAGFGRLLANERNQLVRAA